MKDIVILGIESSCDETSAALVRNGREVLSNIIYSQIDIHQPYGGVVPEIASRNHVKKISSIVDMAFKEAKLNYSDIDGVAVTYGPGLVGSLLVGLSYAKSFAYAAQKPLIGINHIDGHICANYIGNDDVKPPFLTLVASGGHSHLILVKDYDDYTVLGQTRDDAAGEAFDKISRTLGLGYPGGPAIDKAALLGDPHFVEFPRAYLEEDSFDFSFSGLKSAVLNYLNSMKMKGETYRPEDIAASFQMAVVEVLVEKTLSAAEKYSIQNICLSGGVACNSLLRKIMKQRCQEKNYKLSYPEISLCTDNGAMVASAGYYKFVKKDFAPGDLTAKPNLKI
ncbi:tRNA (adenosine(37)-N6)-threonylcarbamoyltransferase complex transferase subunit TsaD [Alkalibacter mobilis]|uniref:tRNA (adenosine(37)-N6)-threonylcarbamoyltransferase complex transferase subunit TsaD n=1 Tax=Alkalibacter mobilis TaxID=2787712 RepID=UPI00189F4A97|nr:tRNA (adenosine(37)-N6)-threonylcarbamoyltransferase complex transferase subunit TsaD [Alkalibacter mobilis]MBF7096610.1 tRNA (adenosine(37)-N6)-threonylcarbamoyltransferase complex transferase subunit TsaD [Alkalibacter mobilis]